MSLRNSEVESGVGDDTEHEIIISKSIEKESRNLRPRERNQREIVNSDPEMNICVNRYTGTKKVTSVNNRYNQNENDLAKGSHVQENIDDTPFADLETKRKKIPSEEKLISQHGIEPNEESHVQEKQLISQNGRALAEKSTKQKCIEDAPVADIEIKLNTESYTKKDNSNLENQHKNLDKLQYTADRMTPDYGGRRSSSNLESRLKHVDLESDGLDDDDLDSDLTPAIKMSDTHEHDIETVPAISSDNVEIPKSSLATIDPGQIAYNVKSIHNHVSKDTVSTCFNDNAFNRHKPCIDILQVPPNQCVNSNQVTIVSEIDENKSDATVIFKQWKMQCVIDTEYLYFYVNSKTFTKYPGLAQMQLRFEVNCFFMSRFKEKETFLQEKKSYTTTYTYRAMHQSHESTVCALPLYPRSYLEMQHVLAIAQYFERRNIPVSAEGVMVPSGRRLSATGYEEFLSQLPQSGNTIPAVDGPVQETAATVRCLADTNRSNSDLRISRMAALYQTFSAPWYTQNQPASLTVSQTSAYTVQEVLSMETSTNTVQEGRNHRLTEHVHSQFNVQLHGLAAFRQTDTQLDANNVFQHPTNSNVRMLIQVETTQASNQRLEISNNGTTHAMTMTRQSRQEIVQGIVSTYTATDMYRRFHSHTRPPALPPDMQIEHGQHELEQRRTHTSPRAQRTNTVNTLRNVSMTTSIAGRHTVNPGVHRSPRAPQNRYETVATTSQNTAAIIFCIFCAEKEATVKFLPCGHTVCCVNCSRDMAYCLRCGVAVAGRCRDI